MNTTQTHLEFSVYLAEEQSGQLIKKQTVGIAYLPHRHVTYHLPRIIIRGYVLVCVYQEKRKL